MPSDSDGQWEEKELHPDGLYDAYGTIGQGIHTIDTEKILARKGMALFSRKLRM